MPRHKNDTVRDNLNDIELLVEGRIIRTNTGLLSYNSNIFATLITNARASKEAEDNVFMDTVVRRQKSPGRGEGRLTLELPSQRYKDVKILIECLEAALRNSGDLTDEKVFHILPLVDQFRLSNLRKASKKTLVESITEKRKQNGVGNMNTQVVLKYLGVADTYNFETLRKICIEELALHTDASDRKLMMYDKHLAEKTKLKIMDKVCDGLSQDYEYKLKQIRYDMDKRCREIEQRRDEFMEQLETWKHSLQQEVDEAIKANEDVHKQLLEDLTKKNIIDRLDGNIKQAKEEIFIEIKQIKDQMTFVFETMEGDKVIGEMEAVELKDRLEKAMQDNTENIESITERFKSKVAEGLKVCCSKEVEAGIASGYELENNMKRIIEELEANVKNRSLYHVKLEEEKLAHEKTKALLMKMKIKEHEINTWLKWAKPVSDDPEKCMCFRHVVDRKP